MPVFTIQAEAGVVCMAADEAKSKLFSGGPSVDVWDIASAQKVSQLVSLFEDDEAKLVPLNSMSYSQNLLAGGSVAGTVSLWDTRTSELCFSFGCSSDGLRSSLPIRQVQVDDWKLACIAGAIRACFACRVASARLRFGSQSICFGEQFVFVHELFFRFIGEVHADT
eukprot:jgi/Pico_ML_1/52083/g2847.t1